MSLGQLLKEKNNMSIMSYPRLPEAFAKHTMKDVVEGLLKDGYDVYDVVVDGKTINMARHATVEIYFNNQEAVFASIDYGRCEGRAFPISLIGTFHTHRVPQALWCNI